MQRDSNVTSAHDSQRKLTQPLENAVLVILVFLAGLFATLLVLAAWRSNVTIFGFGRGPACTDAPMNGLTTGGSGGNILSHMRPGGSSGAAQLEVCSSRPTAGQRTLATLAQAPVVVLYLAILLLLWQLLGAVRRAGPFAELIARRLRFLAWFILAGSLAVAIGQSAAKSAFTSTLVTDPVPFLSNAINAAINGLFPPLLIVCGLLTLARVIRLGAQMNDDLAGTV